MVANISNLMRARGLNQTQLAARAGLGKTALSNYLSGRNGVRPDNLKKLAMALGVSPEQLLGPPGTDAATALVREAAGEYGGLRNFDVQFDGPLNDQPAVDLPFADGKILASFDPELGLSLLSFIGSRTVRLYLRPGELPERYRGAMVVEIWGDSMEPQLHSGDRMIVWLVPESKWHTLHNTACVVAYDDTVTVKAIRENELLTDDRLTLRAANPRAGYFAVGRNSIRSIWEVREYFDRPRFTLAA